MSGYAANAGPMLGLHWWGTVCHLGLAEAFFSSFASPGSYSFSFFSLCDYPLLERECERESRSLFHHLLFSSLALFFRATLQDRCCASHKVLTTKSVCSWKELRTTSCAFCDESGPSSAVGCCLEGSESAPEMVATLMRESYWK